MAAVFRKGIDLNNQQAINGADPATPTALATKQYVDNVANSRDWKESTRAATTANIALSGTQTIDGVAVVAGDRVLVKDQTAGSANGVYVVTAGAWARAADADTSAKVNAGMTVASVEEGTINGDKRFVLVTNNPITLGTTVLVFTPDGGAAAAPTAGAGLTGGVTSYEVGAGTGIAVAADTVGIDTNVVVRKFAANCVATTNPQTFAHGLGTADLEVTIRRVSDGAIVFADVTMDATNVTVDWGSAPTASEYRLIAQG